MPEKELFAYMRTFFLVLGLILFIVIFMAGMALLGVYGITIGNPAIALGGFLTSIVSIAGFITWWIHLTN